MTAGRDMRVSLVLRLQDRVSQGLTRLQSRLEGIGSVMRRISGIALLGGGLAFAPAIARAAELETNLRGIAVTAGRTGQAVAQEVNRMRDVLGRTALDYRTSTTSLVGVLDLLTTRGFRTLDMDGAVRMVARVGAASGAAQQDLAELLVVMDRVSGIRTPEAQLDAFARMFRAGQVGGFELREVARHMDGVLERMRDLGLTGTRAVENASAALAVLRDRFTTAPEAAGALNQLLGQLLSDGTRRRLREYGVDLQAVYQDALRQAARGVDIDPVEALFQRLREITGNDRARLAELLPNENARRAFLAWSENAGRYVSLRRELRAAGTGPIDQAARDRAEGLGAEMRQLNETLAQLGNRLGQMAGTIVPLLNQGFGRLLELVRAVDTAYPGLIDTVGSGIGGFLLAAGAIGLLARALGLVLSPLRWVVMALIGLFGLKVAAFVAVVAAIAGAAYLIYKNWGRLVTFFSGLWDSVKGLFSGAWDYIRPIVDAIADGASRIASILPERVQTPPSEAQRTRARNFGQRGAAAGFYPPEDAAPGGARETRVGGEITVRAAPGTEVVDTRSRNPGVPIVAPNRGAVVGVP